ncbi:hypothetical protein NN561_019824 [Cricetulus griseus]
MGGSSQAWREEARPGSSARCGAPARGGLPGAQRGVGRRPLLDLRGNAGGVSALTPCPPLAGLRESSRRSFQRATSSLEPAFQPSLGESTLLGWRPGLDSLMA